MTTAGTPRPSSDITPTFSGHETFVLRSTWLKKAYDVLHETPDLFSRDDAFVLLGVGKNMAQSIRFWGRACDIFQRPNPASPYTITPFGHDLLHDTGWDPFLVTPMGRWLLHWKIVTRPDAAFTWYYTFNALRGGEFTVSHLGAKLQAWAMEHNKKVPSDATITRDVDCMLRCYVRPSRKQLAGSVEDMLLCPLNELGLIQALPGQRYYTLSSGTSATLPDVLVAFAIHEMLRTLGRRTISFSELAYLPCAPGRVFRLDEDSLLARIHRIDTITDGAATYSDQAGIRQVAWQGTMGDEMARQLLEHGFAQEMRV